jgi:Na+-transporting NADH:ubiquinone oxidoreductase subunit F
MTTVVITAVLSFTIVTLLLVALLLFAQKKLVASGNVSIVINGEKTIEAPIGSSLLSTLSDQAKLFLPSACGGKGSCAMCKCVVEEGGGDVLPSEEGQLSRKEKQEGVRLACQVKVKGNMKVRVPEEVFGIKKWECTVVSNYNVATFIKEFVVKLPEGENLKFESGGYIQVDVPPITVNFKDIDISTGKEDDPDGSKYATCKEQWDKFKMWDLKMVNPEPIFRAYSMANHPAEGNIIMLNIRIATPPWDRANNKWMDVNPGICSSFVFSRKPGDKVTISGPYGEFRINPTQREMVYIGGGAGMAPLRSQIFHLFHTERTNRKVSYWYGGRSLKELFYTEHFRKIEQEFPNFKYHIALSEPLPEDNWKVKSSVTSNDGDGFVGFIHNALYENYLKTHPEPEDIEYYLCGPPLMIQAVMKMLDSLGVPPENIRFDDFGS